jgi:hypothetical protein
MRDDVLIRITRPGEEGEFAPLFESLGGIGRLR